MDIYTLALSIAYSNKIGKQIKDQAFKTQIELNRDILNNTGEENIFYFLPKEVGKPQNGYDEYIYFNNKWELMGGTDIDLSNYYTKEEAIQKINENKIKSATVNQNGTITFALNDNSTITTSGTSVIGEQGEPGQDYILTEQDKDNIANLVLQKIPDADTMNF